MRAQYFRPVLAAAALSAASCGDPVSANAHRTWLPKELSGGNATIFLASEEAFSNIAPNLNSLGKLLHYRRGLTLFHVEWQASPAPSFAGLGPVYNRTSCAGCHERHGRGRPPRPDEPSMDSMVVQLSAVKTDTETGAPIGLPGYGNQLGNRAITGHTAEGRVTIRYREKPGAFPDGETYSLRVPEYRFDWHHGDPGEFRFSPRVAPAVIGLGLLAAIPESTLLALADETDADGDGISGRANRVWDYAAGELRLGRFGWKAGQPSIDQQSHVAFHEDLGITSGFSARRNGHDAANPELAASDSIAIDYFMHLLAVPARRDVRKSLTHRGEVLFEKIGCASCHVAELRTGHLEGYAEVTHQTIRPYTDLLLHDLGEELSDGRSEFRATPREWRTPPLWGLGLIETVNGHDNLLHDGRARGVQEAILWHGGEAARHRDAYKQLKRSDRRAVLAFLKSL